jgi:glutamyl-Q tRNA(Asp) synthetase
LQSLLGYPMPRYLHTPLVWAADGEKLSKGHGAVAIEPGVAALSKALRVLGIEPRGQGLEALLVAAIEAWRARWQDTGP